MQKFQSPKELPGWCFFSLAKNYFAWLAIQLGLTGEKTQQQLANCLRFNKLSCRCYCFLAHHDPCSPHNIGARGLLWLLQSMLLANICSLSQPRVCLESVVLAEVLKRLRLASQPTFALRERCDHSCLPKQGMKPTGRKTFPFTPYGSMTGTSKVPTGFLPNQP